jgi:hypothetical protein
MEIKTITTKYRIIHNQKVQERLYQNIPQYEPIKTNPVYAKLEAEGCENFFDYVEWLGLAKDPNIIVLSCSHHYYYDAEDFKEVGTVINLKLLNQIKQIRNFLHTIYQILPQKSNFIGCFINRKNQIGFSPNSNSIYYPVTENSYLKDNGLLFEKPFLSVMFNMINFRSGSNMTERTVRSLFENTGFKILDMTEMKGLTYFCAKKVNP